MVQTVSEKKGWVLALLAVFMLSLGVRPVYSQDFKALKSDKLELKEVMDVNLSKGYTYAEAFVLNGETFVFCHNKDTGLTSVWNLKKGGAPVFQKTWSKGWSNMNFFKMFGRVYFFHQKGNDGLARLVAMDYDKLMAGESMGEKVKEENWSSGWTATKFFVRNNIAYFFHYKKDSGLARLNGTATAGEFGKKIYEKTWKKDYDNFSLIEQGLNIFLLYQQSSTGLTKINKINKSKIQDAVRGGLETADLGTVVYDKDWSSGWTDTFFFTLGDAAYLFHYKSGTGLVRIDQLSEGGDTLTQVYEGNWTTGWSNFAIFYNDDKPYLFGQKKSTGRTAINEIRLK